MIMSETTIMPVSIISALTGSGGFVPMRMTAGASEATQRDDGYARGLADGQNMAETAFSAERHSLQKLLASAEALRPDDNEELALLLRETVMRLVRQIVGDVSANAGFLDEQISQVMAALTEADNARTLLLNPNDMALLADFEFPLPIKADADLPRGAVRIACSEGWIEHGPGFTLGRLDALLASKGGQT